MGKRQALPFRVSTAWGRFASSAAAALERESHHRLDQAKKLTSGQPLTQDNLGSLLKLHQHGHKNGPKSRCNQRKKP